jgi:hypothetical protein
MSGREVSLLFRGERIQCPISCISRRKGGRRASSKLTTKEGWLSTRNLAARLSKIPLAVTIPLRQFHADHFFRFEKKERPPCRTCGNYNTQDRQLFNAFTSTRNNDRAKKDRKSIEETSSLTE